VDHHQHLSGLERCPFPVPLVFQDALLALQTEVGAPEPSGDRTGDASGGEDSADSHRTHPGDHQCQQGHAGEGADRCADGDSTFNTTNGLCLDIAFEHMTVRPMEGDSEMLVCEPGRSQVIHGCLSRLAINEDGSQLGVVGGFQLELVMDSGRIGLIGHEKPPRKPTLSPTECRGRPHTPMIAAPARRSPGSSVSGLCDPAPGGDTGTTPSQLTLRHPRHRTGRLDRVQCTTKPRLTRAQREGTEHDHPLSGRDVRRR
jgi:hypothetical protein